MKESELEDNALYMEKLDELTELTQNPEKVSHISPMGEPITSHPTEGGYVVDEIADLAQIGVEELEEPETFVAIDPNHGGGLAKVEEELEDDLVVTIIEPEPETEDGVNNRHRNTEGEQITIDKKHTISISSSEIDDMTDIFKKDNVSMESRDSFDDALSKVYNDLTGS